MEIIRSPRSIERGRKNHRGVVALRDPREMTFFVGMILERMAF